MRYVLLSGGLGNQLYQYTFARFLETRTGETCIFDDSSWWSDGWAHNGYELEKIFGLKLNLLGNFLTEDVKAEMVRIRKEGTGILQQLNNNGMDFALMAEFNDHSPFDGAIINMPPNGVDEISKYIYLNAKGNIYYHGYWVRPEWVRLVEKELKQELVFPTLDVVEGLPEINKAYAEQIASSDAAAVHIRRGDFIQCGRVVSLDRYARSIAWIEERYKGCNYFIFSDDIDWCEEHKTDLGLHNVKGKVVFTRGNTGNGFNYVDMQLMSMCPKMIISNSSFGQWASYLNYHLNKVVLLADVM